MGETLYNSDTDVLYVFPDKICEELLPVMRNRYITTTKNITYENARELERLFAAEYTEQADSGALYGVRFSTLQTNSAIANNFILQTGMIYGAGAAVFCAKGCNNRDPSSAEQRFRLDLA